MDNSQKKELDFKTPPEVTDVEAYRKYQKWSSHPIVTSKKFYTASDNKAYNLGLIKPRLIQLTAHLPEAERKVIVKMKDLFSEVHCRANAYKVKAFRSADRIKGWANLLDSKTAEVIELFGRMYTAKEVHKVCVEDWHMSISIDTISEFRRKNEGVITDKIEAFKRDYSDIRLGIKKSRIEELVWMYSQRKTIYNQTKKKEDYELMLKTLEQLRKEVEGNTMTLNGKFEIDQEVRIKQHVVQEVMKTLNVKQIVLGRIAAKNGVNPLLLQKSILDSYYGKYFNSEHIAELEPPTPTNETYDFNRINQLVKQNEEADQRYLVAQAIPQSITVEQTEDIKKQLISKLLNLSGKAINVKNNLNSEH